MASHDTQKMADDNTLKTDVYNMIRKYQRFYNQIST